MGRPKALLPWQGTTLLEWLAARLSPGFTTLLVAATDLALVPESLRARAVLDGQPGQGPLAGLVAGFHVAPHRPLVAVACDMPNVTPALLRRLLSASRGWDAAVPCLAGRAQATCAAYQPCAAAALERALLRGQLKLQDALGSLAVNWLAGVEPRLFENVNTPSDYWRLSDETGDRR